VVPQESILFDGTIRENVAHAMDDADEGPYGRRRGTRTRRTSSTGSPGGSTPLVGEHGARLSGGQRQRLAI
jgi:ATP-binding cassette subfamily B protein